MQQASGSGHLATFQFLILVTHQQAQLLQGCPKVRIFILGVGPPPPILYTSMVYAFLFLCAFIRSFQTNQQSVTLVKTY